MLTRRTTIGAGAALVAAGLLGTARAADAGRPAPLVGPATGDDIHVMTYNIRVPQPTSSPGDPDHWQDRAPHLARLLASEQPTLLGVQEATGAQLATIAAALPGHRMLGFGYGAETLAGHQAVLYDTDRFAPLTWDQCALSETPEVVDSTGWGNAFPRSLTRVRLADLRTGRELVLLNTHFDHASEYARVCSARLVRAHVADLDVPVVVTGDFNADADRSLPCAVLTGDGRLRDTWHTARIRSTPAWGTFPSYADPREGGRRIDWVLAGEGVEVARTAINTTTYDGAWPSDHTPVQALVQLT